VDVCVAVVLFLCTVSKFFMCLTSACIFTELFQLIALPLFSSFSSSAFLAFYHATKFGTHHTLLTAFLLSASNVKLFLI